MVSDKDDKNIKEFYDQVFCILISSKKENKTVSF